MKSMKWWQVVLAAFGLAAAIGYMPILSAIAIAILVVVYREAEIKGFAGTTTKFVTTFVSSLAIAILTQVILSWLFGVSLKSVADAGGLAGVLQHPEVMTPVVFKEVIALIATICVFYLWYTSPGQQRWLYKLGLVVSVVYLGYQAFDAYAPLSADTKARQQTRIALFRQDAGRWWESWQKKSALALNRDGSFRELRSEVPPKQRVTKNTLLMTKDTSDVLVPGSVPVTQGSVWYVYPEDADRDQNKLPGCKVVSVDDPTVSGYLMVDVLADYEEMPEAPNALAQIAKANEQYTSPEPPIVMAMQSVAEKHGISEDVVIATTEKWIDTEVIPRVGDVVEFGPFEKSDDVKRIVVRIGGERMVQLEPVEIWDGRYIGRLTCVGGSNVIGAPERVKLIEGPDLSVRITKSRPY